MSSLVRALRALDDVVEQARGPGNFPGVAVTVTDRDKTRYEGAYGVAALGGRPVGAGDLFEIGSISKSFTALAVLEEVDAGRLDLQDDLRDRLPWFEVQAQHTEPITVHHLLTHTAGIVQGSEATTEARSEVWGLRETPAVAPPGTWFHYSNVGYKALGLVLEELTGRPYPELLRSRVLEPLGLAATEPAITNEVRDRLVTGHEAFLDDRPLPPGGRLAPATWGETATADGSIASSAADMATYLRMLLNGGRGAGGQLVSAPAFAAMTTAHIADSDLDDPGAGYGYGLDVLELAGHRCLAHGGGMVGYTAHILADLDAGLGITVLTNGPGGPTALARHTLALVRAGLAGAPLPAPPPALLNPAFVPGAATYAGTYLAGDRRVVVRAVGDRLELAWDGVELGMLGAGGDAFHLVGPGLGRYLARFERRLGAVVALAHGPDRYRRAGAGDLERPAEPGGDLRAVVGHYRAHNPWFTNFRVVLREGAPVLIAPGGVEAPEDEPPLLPAADGSFRVGADPRSPERLRFDLDDAAGRPWRATYSGCAYHRTFTP